MLDLAAIQHLMQCLEIGAVAGSLALAALVLGWLLSR